MLQNKTSTYDYFMNKMWHSKFPQESPIQRFPQESGIHLPSRKLIPSRFWKLVPYRVRTSLPSFIQSYSSQGLITGLSSANRPRRSSSYPQRSSSKVPQHNLSTHPQRSLSLSSPEEFIIIIPSGSKELYSSTSAQDLIPRPVVKDLFS